MSSNATVANGTAKLIVLSAPSGAGKSTLCSMLLAKRKNFVVSISHTTRAPRGEEKDGIHYYFVDEKQFQSMVSAGDFLEHAHVFGRSWYGTSRTKVEEALARGTHVLFDIDVQGARSLKKIYGKRCVTIFILPPSFEELEKRLRARATETEQAIQTRLATAKKELQEQSWFDYRIVNKDLNQSLAELEGVLKKEGCIP